MLSVKPNIEFSQRLAASQGQKTSESGAVECVESVDDDGKQRAY